MSEDTYDICILGGGPAGYAAAMRAIDFGKKVVLVERDRLGGAGIYNGALSSKTLWELSEKVRSINSTLTSHDRRRFEIDWDTVRQTMNEAIFDKKNMYSVHLKLLKEESTQSHFKYLRGIGEMLSSNKIKITGKEGKIKTIQAEHIIIATGGRPRTLPHIAVDEKIIMTSNGIHHIEDYPKSMVIVGAGVIGCEYATIFANFGRTKVYLIDRADRILPFEDEDISYIVHGNLKAKGVTIHQRAGLKRMEVVDGMVEYEVELKDGSCETIQVEKALLSIGRVPNIESIGMANAGVFMSKRGVHIGDDDTQTNVPNIYAVGDVSGHIALVNVGEIEARHAVEKIFTGKTERLSYDNICTIMFLQPEVAAVGLNEQRCVRDGIPVKIVKLDFSCITRAIAMRSTQGFFKIIVSDDDEMKILGMRAIGQHASSAIQAVALLIKMNKGVEELAELVHPHPSIIEGVQECVRMLLNKSLLKSPVFKDKMQCYRLKDGVKTPLQSI